MTESICERLLSICCESTSLYMTLFDYCQLANFISLLAHKKANRANLSSYIKWGSTTNKKYIILLCTKLALMVVKFVIKVINMEIYESYNWMTVHIMMPTAAFNGCDGYFYAEFDARIFCK